MPETKPRRRRRRWDDPDEPKAASLTLEPGQYQLKCDLKNPRPYGRQSYHTPWHDLQDWKKGARFVVLEDPTVGKMSFVVEGKAITAPAEVRLTTPRQIWCRLRLGDPRSQVVVANLEPIQEAPSEWLHRVSLGDDSIAAKLLDILVANGRLELADLQTVYTTHFSKQQGAAG